MQITQVMNMTNHEFELLAEQVEKLDLEQQKLLFLKIQQLIEIQEESLRMTPDTTLNTWTQEELEELLAPEEPLTGQEMIEQGYFGGWEDMGIEDGAEWVNAQRALSKAKRKKKIGW